jgi:hypothetical protein
VPIPAPAIARPAVSINFRLVVFIVQIIVF